MPVSSPLIPPPPRAPIRPRPAAKPRALPFYRRLSYRRTLIPILLTGGVCLAAFGAAKWVCDPDTILAQQPRWAAIAFVVSGAVSVLLGMMTMVQVRHDLKKNGPPTVPPGSH